MGGKMKTRKAKLTNEEYGKSLLRLKKLGIPIGSAPDPSPKPKLILQQIHHEFARLYELPAGALAVVAPARMMVLASQVLITEVEMTTPWDDWPLELEDPEEWPCYKDVMEWLPPSTKVLNRQLTSGTPLSRHRVEGTVLAFGWSKVPPQCHDNTPLRVDLSLWDENFNEIVIEFGVVLDRTFLYDYERKQAGRREGMRVNARGTGLFGPNAGPMGGQSRVLPEEGIKPRHATGNDDAEYRKPT
jgi:hypothetical protein